MTNPLIATTVMSLLACSTLAEDRSRFYLSASFGPSFNHLEAQPNGETIKSNSTGLYTSFKIGGHATNQFALYFLEEISIGFTGGSNGNGIAGHSGIGATYYFANSHGPYIEVAGLSSFTFLSGTDEDTFGYGYGVSLGGGYEISDHVQLGIVYTHAYTDDFINIISSDEVENMSFNSIAAKVEFKL